MTEAVATKEKKGALHWLDENFESIFLVIGMLAIIFLITWQVAYRYIFTKFTSGASTMVAAAPEEIARYIFVWISYLAVPVAIKRRDLIRVDILYDKLPKRLQGMSWVIVDAAMLIWAGIITVQGVLQIEKFMRFSSATAVLHIPFWLLYMVLPVAFGLCILRTLQDVYKQVRECGLVDSLIAIAVGIILCLPLILHIKAATILYLFGYFVILLALGVPISMSLGIASIFTIWANHPIDISYVAQLSFAAIDKTAIMCIPFFVASGDLMGIGGLSRRLFSMADEFLGSAYGGLALATVATCVLFGAMSGSGPATVAAIGALCVPAMVERGYDQKFSAAIVACAGAIGVLIRCIRYFGQRFCRETVYGRYRAGSAGSSSADGIQLLAGQKRRLERGRSSPYLENQAACCVGIQMGADGTGYYSGRYLRRFCNSDRSRSSGSFLRLDRRAVHP